MAFTPYAVERTPENHKPFPARVLDLSGEIISLDKGALQDIQIKCFFPADEETQKLCEAL
mgnify:CR=1 FL=1